MRICDGYLMSLDNTLGTSDRRSSIDEHQNPFATENVRNPKKEHESDDEVKVLVYRYLYSTMSLPLTPSIMAFLSISGKGDISSSSKQQRRTLQIVLTCVS
jgi:hypothetical protein